MDKFNLLNPLRNTDVTRIDSGTQIDFVLLDESLSECIEKAEVLGDAFSDH